MTLGGDTRLLNMFFVLCWAFNAASFQSILNGGPAFSRTDPMVGSAVLLVIWVPLMATNNNAKASKAHSITAVLGAWILLAVSALHVLNRDVYLQSSAYHDKNWRYAVIINAFGAYLFMARAMEKWKRGTVCIGSILLFALSVRGAMGGISKLTPDDSLCSDAPFFQISTEPMFLPTRSFQYKSQYVEMSDGVELAVDVYLPNDYVEGEDKLPTFLHLTRYHRAEARSWFARYISLFGHPPNKEGIFPMRSLHYLNIFVPAGYAFVSVDIRGTGASFGGRPLDLIDREVQDFGEIAAWTRNQTFCNGRIGTGGISYDGITGALMAAQGGIDAAALLFAPNDLWEDIAFVGGIPTIGFIDMYGKFTTASENNVPVNDVDNELPAFFKVISNWVFRGVAPVFGSEHRLKDAVKEHEHNFDMLAKARCPSVQFRDSTLVTTPDGKNHSANDLGITRNTYEKLVEHDVSVYSIAGYYDSGSIRSAARLHNHLIRRGGDSKLTIGPWSHGARACWTPAMGATATSPQYPLFLDVKRFFDCKLKDVCKDGISTEPPLHYFLSGADQWRASTGEWPPKDLEETTIGLDSMDILPNRNAAQKKNGKVTTTVDFSATTGIVSRWNLVQHLMKKAVTYSNRSVETSGSLVFRKVQESSLKIVGSPRLELSLALVGEAKNGGPPKDAALFVYLEEVNLVTGTHNYVTESAVRVSHRVTSVENHNRVGSFDSIYRSYTEKDFRPWVANEFMKVEVLLEPVAYLVSPNSELRVVLAGADVDNFYLENLEGLANKWEVDVVHSRLVLPVAPS